MKFLQWLQDSLAGITPDQFIDPGTPVGTTSPEEKVVGTLPDELRALFTLVRREGDAIKRLVAEHGEQYHSHDLTKGSSESHAEACRVFGRTSKKAPSEQTSRSRSSGARWRSFSPSRACAECGPASRSSPSTSPRTPSPRFSVVSPEWSCPSGCTWVTIRGRTTRKTGSSVQRHKSAARQFIGERLFSFLCAI